MTPIVHEPVPNVYFWPGSIEEDPVSAPISEICAIDIAIKATARAFPGVEYTDICSREAGSKGISAHKILLWLLDKTSIDYQIIADELGYVSEEFLERKIEATTNQIEELITTDGIVHNKAEIARGRFSQYLGELATRRQPDNATEPQQLSALSQEARKLFGRARADHPDALETLRKRYEPVIDDFINGLPDDAPAEVIDEAWVVFNEHLQSADLNSPIDFTATLYSKIETRLAEVIELQRVAEVTSDLNIKVYLSEVEEFGVALKKDKIKSSLDPAVIDKELAGALEYLKSRFQKGTRRPIKGYFRIKPEVRPILAGRIRRAYEKILIKNLKLSVIMYERGIKEFHLAQLPEELKDKFLAIALDETARIEIERYNQHQRKV